MSGPETFTGTTAPTWAGQDWTASTSATAEPARWELDWQGPTTLTVPTDGNPRILVHHTCGSASITHTFPLTTELLALLNEIAAALPESDPGHAGLP